MNNVIEEINKSIETANKLLNELKKSKDAQEKCLAIAENLQVIADGLRQVAGEDKNSGCFYGKEVKRFIDTYFQPSGRIRRAEFWNVAEKMGFGIPKIELFKCVEFLGYPIKRTSGIYYIMGISKRR